MRLVNSPTRRCSKKDTGREMILLYTARRTSAIDRSLTCAKK